MATRKRKKRSRHLWLWVLLGAAGLWGGSVLIRSLTYTDPTVEGRLYLQGLEDLELPELQSQLNALKSQELSQAVASGETSIFSMLHDFAFLGDSRSLALKEYNLLEPGRVIAYTGENIGNIEDHLEEVQKLSPNSIIVAYGINDVENGLGGSEEGYEALAEDQLRKLQEAVPGAKIYVNSIIPALSSDPAWQRLAAWNQALQTACEKVGAVYIDNNYLASDYASLYEPDGIHFQYSFYTPWMENIVKAMNGDVL